MTTRPDGFDAALVAYLPKLKRRAFVVAKNAADDLVQSTVAMMLEKADECRMETFKTWAKIIMLRVSSDYARRAKAEKRTGVMVPESAAYAVAQNPNQEHHVALVEALEELATMRHGQMVVDEAMGDGIPVNLGRTVYERLRFRRQAARKRLIARMAA